MMKFTDDALSCHQANFLLDQNTVTMLSAVNSFTMMAEHQMGKKLKKI